METLLPYILSLSVIPLFLYLTSFICKSKSNLPPGTTGWPVLGENKEFSKLGSEKFVKDRMEKHSPDVFQTSLLGVKMALFCGAQGNKFLFMNDTKLFDYWSPPALKRLLPHIEESNCKEQLALQRSFHHDVAFKLEALKQYIGVMDAMARDHIRQEWNPNANEEIKVFQLSKKYTWEVAFRIFLNMVDPEEIKKLADSFTVVLSGLSSLPINFPGTAFYRAKRARKMVREQMLRIIGERRREMMMNMEKTDKEYHLDCLSKALLLRNEDGKYLSEMEIYTYILRILSGSFDTTSTAITCVINFLAENPHVYEKVSKEQMEIAKSKRDPDELLTWEDVEKMKYSWDVVRETLRLNPPTEGGFRESSSEFTYAGFTIPKGWKTFSTVLSTHKNPKYFPEPEKFDPSRFSNGSGPAPYTFIPFWGGPRMCPGREFARLQVLVFMHNVVTRFKLIEKAIPNEKIVFLSYPTPEYGLPIRLQPHDHNY